jgi:VWFA-related protein
MLSRWSLSFALFCFVATLYSHAAGVSTSPTYRSKVKVVLLDVSVAGRNDEPISGLKQSDFRIFEAGKKQAIASFEEHTGAPATQPAMPPLPPHYYTNYPLSKPADSANVLMLDALNTPLADQAYVRAQMVKYLKEIQPGPRLAILTLTSRVRIVEGFTTDPAALLAALNHKNWGGGPQSSLMLRTEVDDDVDQQVMGDLALAGGGSAAASAQSSFEVMQEFMTEQTSYQNRQRIQMTLNALQQVARYLEGFPGRKNVIWFSGSFPLSLLPAAGHGYDQSSPQGFTEKIKRTTNMLAAAQVAIYPVGPAGLIDNSSGRAFVAHPTTSVPGSGALDGGAGIRELERHDEGLYSSQAAMDDIARDTGGEAFTTPMA